MYYSNPEQFKSLCGYEIDGFWYPRVTKIVEIKAKPALYRFYAEMENFDAGEKIKQQSASEGTQIHNIVEQILMGTLPSIPSSVEPSIKVFLEFLSQRRIQVDPELVEKRIVNYNDRYAGTIDAIAVIDGKLGILDIKTSQAIYRDYNLQTAAYLAAVKDSMKGIQTRWILRIDQNQICLKCGAILRTKGGNKKIKTVFGNSEMEHCDHQWSEVRGQIEFQEFPFWEKDFHAFLGAKRLWEWENEYWLKQIGYL